MSARTNRQWRLVARPHGRLQPSDFRWTEEPAAPPADGQVLVRTVYLSLDPTNRGWAAFDTYLPAVRLGEVMRGIALGVVEESRHGQLKPGDLVQGMLGWQAYATLDGRELTPAPTLPGVRLDASLALFGHIGATAYFGLLDVGKARAGETLVVSGAAGAVGSLVGQIAKLHGMRVIGIAGGPEKCRWLTGELGFDAAIDYKGENVPRRLRETCPNGIDVYFDNVGGEILDAALGCLALRGRVVLCGLISQYNASEPPPGPRNLSSVLVRRARIEGFIVLDYQDRFPEAASALGGWLAQGKIQYRVDLVTGLENAPEALNRLFDGKNVGKLLVQVSEEPA